MQEKTTAINYSKETRKVKFVAGQYQQDSYPLNLCPTLLPYPLAQDTKTHAPTPLPYPHTQDALAGYLVFSWVATLSSVNVSLPCSSRRTVGGTFFFLLMLLPFHFVSRPFIKLFTIPLIRSLLQRFFLQG